MGAGFIFSSGLGNAIVCGLWTYFATIYAGTLMSVWAGFAGCTSYFIAGGGKNGIIRSLCSNLAGILIASIIILCGNIVNGPIFAAVCTGFFTLIMCYLGHCDLTKFVPCTFIGGFSTFASNGNWQMCLICIILGNFVGLASDSFGRWIYNKFFKGKTKRKEDWIIGKVLND